MTLHNSTRYALPSPNGDDPLINGDNVLRSLVDLLDTIIATAYKGTLAARPAAGKAGRFYWATDTSKLYHDTGTTWSTIGPLGLGTAADQALPGNTPVPTMLGFASFARTAMSVPIFPSSTPIVWDIEDDPDNWHAPGSANIIVPADGLYWAALSCEWSDPIGSGAEESRMLGLQLLFDGSIAAQDVRYGFRGTSINYSASVAFVGTLLAAQAISATVFQDNESNVTSTLDAANLGIMGLGFPP